MSETGPRAITSLTNDRIKAIRALEMRKERKQTGLFVAEGPSILVTARDAGFVPTSLVYQAGTTGSPASRSLVGWALDAGADVLEVSEAVLAKLASKENPQAMLGVFRQRLARPEAFRSDAEALYVGLEGPRDPGNLGTIVRTADAVGADGVLLIGDTVDPFDGSGASV